MTDQYDINDYVDFIKFEKTKSIEFNISKFFDVHDRIIKLFNLNII